MNADKKLTCLVTVGTTKFNALIESVDSASVADALIELGFSHLFLQIGQGEYIPERLIPDGQTEATIDRAYGSLSIEYFRLVPSLAEYVDRADLVISHAGAGSIFEALNAGKRVIAVPNPLLMGNHQKELANHLQKQGYLVSSNLDGVERAIFEVQSTKLNEYKAQNALGISKHIDSLFDSL